MKNTLKKGLVVSGVVLLMAGFAGSVFAAIGVPTNVVAIPAASTSITGIEGVIDLFAQAANWVFTIFLIVGVITLILAAFKFLTAGGDPTAVQSARSMVLYAAVGFGVAFLALAVPNVVADLLGVADPVAPPVVPPVVPVP